MEPVRACESGGLTLAHAGQTAHDTDMNAIVKIGDTEYEPARLDRAGILALAESGVIERLGRVEVIDGVIVKMSPSWTPHSKAHLLIGSFLVVHLADRFTLGADHLVMFGDGGMHAPDIAVFDKGMDKKAPDSSDLRLAVEVADSSLGYDLGDKADIYAAHGVPELWVVDLEHRTLVIHRDPGETVYGSVVTQPWTDSASPLIAPDLTVRLADILAD